MEKLKEKFETVVVESQKQNKDQMPISLVDKLPSKGRGSMIKTTEISPDKAKSSVKKGGRGRRQSFSPDTVLSKPAGKTLFSLAAFMYTSIYIYMFVSINSLFPILNEFF